MRLLGDLLKVDPDRLSAVRADCIGSGVGDIVMEVRESGIIRLSSFCPHFSCQLSGGRSTSKEGMQRHCHELARGGGFRSYGSGAAPGNGLPGTSLFRQIPDLRDENIQFCLLVPIQRIISLHVYLNRSGRRIPT